MSSGTSTLSSVPTPVEVVDRMMSEQPMFHRDLNGADRCWNALPESLLTIANVVEPGQRTLETGCGASTVVFAAAGSQHTTISTVAYEHGRVAEYCTDNAIATSGLTFVEGLSDIELPKMDLDELDMAFIDGGHSFPYAIVDWHYIAGALKVGGLLLLDDLPIPAVRVLHDHMDADPMWEMVSVADQRAGLYRKLGTSPDPDQGWREQAFNASYPDYSFLPDRRDMLQLSAQWKLKEARQWAARRFPGAKDTFRKVVPKKS